jgi:hypothetical protein
MFKVLLRRFLRGLAWSLVSGFLIKKGVPAETLGPLGDALGVPVVTGGLYTLDKAVREWWKSRK